MKGRNFTPDASAGCQLHEYTHPLALTAQQKYLLNVQACPLDDNWMCGQSLNVCTDRQLDRACHRLRHWIQAGTQSATLADVTLGPVQNLV